MAKKAILGVEELARANCSAIAREIASRGGGRKPPEEKYSCKTCKKKFSSFQSYGGHRSSHKRMQKPENFEINKKRLHRCSVCGREFELGQALGGHMRWHNSQGHTVAAVQTQSLVAPLTTTTNGGALGSRIGIFDLNLTPYENCLDLDE